MTTNIFDTPDEQPCCGEFRPWSTAAGEPEPFPDACGDCGWSRQAHIDMVNEWWAKAAAAARGDR